MKCKIRKYLWIFAMIMALCVCVFTACDGDDSSPDYYFSVNNEGSTDEVASSIPDGATTDSVSTEDASNSSMASAEKESGLNSTQDSNEEVSSSSDSEGEVVDSTDVPPCGKEDYQPGDWVADHSFITTSQDPDCVTTGYSRTFCEYCNWEVEYEVYPALGHKSVTVPGYPSTCCTNGATESKYCSRCSYVLDESEVLPFIDHVYYEGCCRWCDLTLLKFERVKRDFEKEYAICLGPVEYARRVIIPAQVAIMDKDGGTWTLAVKEIADLAFEGHHELYSVEIGANVEKIGAGAFDLCYNLKEVYDKSKTQVTKGGVEDNGWLSNYVKAEDMHYEPFESKISYSETGCIIYTDGDDVRLIGCRNTHNTVIIPEGVTYIESYVFELCYYVTEVIIASTVKYIESRAFYYECATHDDQIEDHLSCKNPIKHVTFLNTEGWYVKGAFDTKDPVKMVFDLSEPLEAWYQLIVLRERVWMQEELLPNPAE